MESTRTMDLGDKGEVTVVIRKPKKITSALVLGHGAGSNLYSLILEGVSQELAKRGVGTLRYNYPYSEMGKGRPDHRKTLLRTVHTAIQEAQSEFKGIPLFAGGHSMSGRMTSMALAEEPNEAIQGVVYLAFPVAGKLQERTEHLEDVSCPLLFLHGTRDRLSALEDIEGLAKSLGEQATLQVIDTADHGFKVLKRSGKTEDDVWEELADAIGNWVYGPRQ